MGRKSKLELTPEIEEALVKQIKAGLPIRYACANAGLDESTFRKWVAKGEGPRAPEMYRTFRAAVTRARAEKVRRLLQHIERAGDVPSAVTGQKDWKAAAWILEHTERDEFHKRADVEAEVKFDHDPKDALARLVARLAAREGASEPTPEPDAGTG